MTISAKNLPCLTLALLTSVVFAQEEPTTGPQKNREPLNRVSSAASTAPRIPGGKPESAAAQNKGTENGSENSSTAENKPETPAPRLAPIGKRDPFRPFTLNARAPGNRRPENLSPLERYELGQLKLVAVIWNVKEPTAMIEDGTGLGYLVKVGTPIGVNEGKVKAIQRNGIVIEEFYSDLYGARKKHEVNMKLSAENAG